MLFHVSETGQSLVTMEPLTVVVCFLSTQCSNWLCNVSVIERTSLMRKFYFFIFDLQRQADNMFSFEAHLILGFFSFLQMGVKTPYFSKWNCK